jgi:hypothetical protein
MDEALQKIIDLLSSLRAASILYCRTGEPPAIEYDILFLGDKFNTILSTDILNALNNSFHMNISQASLETLLPKACAQLNMKCEPMKALKDMENPKPYCYQVILW